MRSYQRSS